jgi:hypothetical protein
MIGQRCSSGNQKEIFIKVPFKIFPWLSEFIFIREKGYLFDEGRVKKKLKGKVIG